MTIGKTDTKKVISLAKREPGLRVTVPWGIPVGRRNAIVPDIKFGYIYVEMFAEEGEEQDPKLL